jgi:hypothetical protein
MLNVLFLLSLVSIEPSASAQQGAERPDKNQSPNKDRKNQTRRGEQSWGLARLDARGGVLVRCAEREEDRLRGV